MGESELRGWTCVEFFNHGGLQIMDAHFNEYLAAVAGMAEIYGTAGDEAPHDETCVAEPQGIGAIA